MSKSSLTKALTEITKKIKWTDQKDVGYSVPNSRDKFYNPLLTPPPRSPSTPDDFKNPQRLGHWQSMGYNWESPLADRYLFHEYLAAIILGSMFFAWAWNWSPDHRLKDWAKREAYLRTHKREALGLPIIDKNVIDPDRIVLPTEEELDGFNKYVSF